MRTSLIAIVLLIIGVLAGPGSPAFGSAAAAESGLRMPTGPGCADDAFENNDTRQTATPVTLPYDQPTLSSCPNDDDWYSFPLAQGAQVQVDALFFHSIGSTYMGNIDISLYNPSGGFLAASATQTDNEKITYTATITGTHYVSVHLFGATPAIGNGYRLQISQTGGSCPDDTLEDNDTLQTAPYFGLPFNFNNLRVCPGDDDYYGFPLNAGDQVRANVKFDHSFGDVDIRLYNQPGNQVANSETGTDNEQINYVAPATGPYAVRVFLFNPPTTGNTYDIQVSIVQVGLPTPTPTPSGPPPVGLVGDANCDGVVNSIDAALVLQLDAGLITNLLICALPDANQNGTINAIDAALILQFSAGLVGNLPPP